MMFLSGAAQQVLGTLGSLQQTVAGVQNALTNGASSPFSLGISAQGTNAANSGTSGTNTWWSNPGTMNALLSAQDSGGAGGTSGSTAPAQGHHGGHHHHSHVQGSQQNSDQNTDGIDTTTGTATSPTSSSAPNSGLGGLLSNLFNQQLTSGSASIGQTLSTLV